MRLTVHQRRATARWTRSTADALAVANGCWFSVSAATRVCQFFEQFLRHSKGEWAGEPFKLLKWQSDEVIKPLFGWMRPDGTRRYRTAYIEIPKKNGKSSLCSGLALYMLIADNEPGSEVYSAASTRDQASIVYKEAANMVKASPSLDARLTRVDSLKHMADERTNSWYKALSADAGSNEGLNIYGLFMDEFHAQRDDKFWNALIYGGAARRQPLKVIITTAGLDQDSLCYEYHTKAMQIQEGLLQDESFFAYVRSAEWTIRRLSAQIKGLQAQQEQAAKPGQIAQEIACLEKKKEQAWKDEAVWYEANPSLGHTISLASFREDFQAAVQSPRLENNFKRYRLNIWTQQEERWLPMDHWAACGGLLEEADLEGQPCFGGLDLASTSDFCAFVLWFPTCGNAALPFFWIPRETVDELERKGDPTYLPWVRQGFLRTTDGNVADYDVIHADIEDLAERFDIKKIAFDRWNATQIVTQLQGDGFEMVQWGQGYASMSAPSKELERLILGHHLRHGQHPVLTWCANNVAVQRDAVDNIKPSKSLSKKKIDGIVALIEAIGVAMLEPQAEESVYGSRGILVL